MIRHGTTAASREGRFQGRLDFPLSPRGKQEAELLARRLSSTGLEMILSSDLRRAWATARIIAAAAGLQPVRMKLLRECSWGAVEGMTLQEIKDCYPGLFRETGRGIRAGIFGGERERRLLARARMVLGIIEQRYSRLRCIALVSHGRFLNALFAAGLGLRAKIVLLMTCFCIQS